MDDESIDLKHAVAANRQAWDQSARLHRDNELWQQITAGFSKPGYSAFDATMTRTLEGVDLTGKSGVQIGCNNGRETLSLMAFGAERCLGIDVSAEFLKQAEELRAVAGLDCEFLCADIYTLPPDIRRDFDFAVITIGVLNWMPDLAEFFRAVAGLLRPGGHLVIYETHPVLEVFEPESDTPFVPEHSYFRKEPFALSEAITYDGGAKQEAATSYWYIHKMSDIIMGVVGAGMDITGFEEHAHSNREAEYAIYENREPQIPMCFILTASRRAE